MAKVKQIEKRVALRDPRTGTKVTVGENQVEKYKAKGYKAAGRQAAKPADDTK